MIQFSYVTWYAPVFPLGPLFALLNNLVEVHTDSYKLLNRYGYQRPLASNSRGINMWKRILFVLSVLAVIVNCGILGIYELDKLFSGLNFEQKFVIVVAAEHVILSLRVMINWAIPKVPPWIQSEKRRRLNDLKDE